MDGLRQGRRAALRLLLPLATLAAALLAGAAPSAHANDVPRIIDEKRVAPRVVELTIATPAFTGPTKVHVNLPAGYDANPDRRWPVTYFLAGTMNSYRTFNTLVDGVGLTESFPSILVSPNGDSGYWSDWFNDGALGPPMYETYVIEQLIPLIDAHFRTIATRAQRVVMGTSMGGYGAMMVAARHPDLFSAAASLSGAVDSTLPANGAVLSISPTFQNAQPDAIYGPRATQEVRWHGHNPTDLAANLRDLDLQVRSANGVPNPAIGEQALSADTVSCVVEGGVYMASVSLHDKLAALDIPHEWADYGAGCHTVPNFEREITDTLKAFTAHFARSRPEPTRFDYMSIEPKFDIWGWQISTDPRRALEFLEVDDASARGLTLVGSGATTVTTPPQFRGLRRVDVRGATTGAAGLAPDRAGRLRFTVDLGAPNHGQQYTPGVTTTRNSRTVTFAPHAIVAFDRTRVTSRRVKVCAHAHGGDVTARIRVVGSRGVPLTARSRRITLRSKTRCVSLRRSSKNRRSRGTVRLSGHDGFGHTVTGRRTIRFSGAGA